MTLPCRKAEMSRQKGTSLRCRNAITRNSRIDVIDHTLTSGSGQIPTISNKQEFLKFYLWRASFNKLVSLFITKCNNILVLRPGFMCWRDAKTSVFVHLFTTITDGKLQITLTFGDDALIRVTVENKDCFCYPAVLHPCSIAWQNAH